MTRWRVFERLYDFPDGYLVAAMVAKFNAAKAFDLGDVIPYYAPARQSQAEMAARLKRFAE